MAWDLASIGDRFEIEDLLVRYSRALDRRDFEALEAIFTDDAEFDAGALGNPKSSRAIREMIEGTLSDLDATQHLVGKSLIELHGDEADVRTYLISQHIRESAPGPTKHYFIGGEYVDLSLIHI